MYESFFFCRQIKESPPRPYDHGQCRRSPVRSLFAPPTHLKELPILYYRQITGGYLFHQVWELRQSGHSGRVERYLVLLPQGRSPVAGSGARTGLGVQHDDYSVATESICPLAKRSDRDENFCCDYLPDTAWPNLLPLVESDRAYAAVSYHKSITGNASAKLHMVAILFHVFSQSGLQLFTYTFA